MIYVIGLGPGHRDYLLPASAKCIKAMDLVIGATRNLASIEDLSIETMDLSMGFQALGRLLVERQDQAIGVVVSGDAGFYSMLSFVKRHIPLNNIKTIPGISSLQYMYSRLCLGYEDSRLVSLHGREKDLTDLIKERVPMGILTDRDHNNQYIAKALLAQGVEDATLYVGEQLSYPEERISRLTVKESTSFKANALSVVIVTYES